jgi:hypothetical protein
MPEDYALYIELKVEADNPGRLGVYVSSPQVPGLHVSGSSFIALKETLEKAIKRLYRDNDGMEVNIIWLTDTLNSPTEKNVLQKLAIRRVAEAA